MKVYIVNWRIYLSLLAGSLVLTACAFLVPATSPFFTIITGIGCGGIASVIVALLIDLANCNRKNREMDTIRTHYLLPIMFEYMQFLMMFRILAKAPNDEAQKRVWNEWAILAIDARHDRCESMDIDFVDERVSALAGKLNELQASSLLIMSEQVLPNEEVLQLQEVSNSILNLKAALFNERYEKTYVYELLNELYDDVEKSKVFSRYNGIAFNDYDPLKNAIFGKAPRK